MRRIGSSTRKPAWPSAFLVALAKAYVIFEGFSFSWKLIRNFRRICQKALKNLTELKILSSYLAVVRFTYVFFGQALGKILLAQIIPGCGSVYCRLLEVLSRK